MKVLHVIPTLAAEEGGPSQAIIEILLALKTVGVDVALLTTSLKRVSERLEQTGNQLSIFTVKNIFKERWGISPELIHWLKKHLRRYDLVHIHKTFCFISLVTIHYCRKYKIPYVIRPAGMLNRYCYQVGRIRKFVYFQLFEKKNIEHAAAIHCTTHYEVEEIKHLMPYAKFKIIPLGTKLFLGSAIPDMAGNGSSSFEQLLERESRKKILFLSRLDPKKGVENLIRSIAILKQKYSDFVLIMAGTAAADYVERIKNLAQSLGVSSNILFTGFLNGRDRILALKAAKIFVLPSYDENFGIAVIEAMAYELPVVITKNVGLFESVEEFRAGIVTSPEPSQLAATLEVLLIDQALSREMGGNGKRLVDSHYRWEKIAPQINNLYCEILNKDSICLQN